MPIRLFCAHFPPFISLKPKLHSEHFLLSASQVAQFSIVQFDKYLGLKLEVFKKFGELRGESDNFISVVGVNNFKSLFSFRLRKSILFSNNSSFVIGLGKESICAYAKCCIARKYIRFTVKAFMMIIFIGDGVYSRSYKTRESLPRVSVI
jgi:hypothetical protein